MTATLGANTPAAPRAADGRSARRRRSALAFLCAPASAAPPTCAPAPPPGASRCALAIVRGGRADRQRPVGAAPWAQLPAGAARRAADRAQRSQRHSSARPLRLPRSDALSTMGVRQHAVDASDRSRRRKSSREADEQSEPPTRTAAAQNTPEQRQAITRADLARRWRAERCARGRKASMTSTLLRIERHRSSRSPARCAASSRAICRCSRSRKRPTA